MSTNHNFFVALYGIYCIYRALINFIIKTEKWKRIHKNVHYSISKQFQTELDTQTIITESYIKQQPNKIKTDIK